MLQWDSCTVTWHSLIRAVGLRCKPLHDGPVELALTQAKLRCPKHLVTSSSLCLCKYSRYYCLLTLNWALILKASLCPFPFWPYSSVEKCCCGCPCWVVLATCWAGLCYAYFVFAIRSERRRHIDSSVGVCFCLATGLGLLVIVKRSRGFTSEITWKRRFSETTR